MTDDDIRQLAKDVVVAVHHTVDFSVWDPRRYWDAWAENLKGAAYTSSSLPRAVAELCRRMKANPAKRGGSANTIEQVLTMDTDTQDRILRVMRDEAPVVVALARVTVARQRAARKQDKEAGREVEGEPAPEQGDLGLDMSFED